jgi:hypothetical protein
MTIQTSALLPATLTSIFTATAGKGNGNAVVMISFCNTQNTANTLYLYLVPSGSSLTNTTPGGSTSDSPYILCYQVAIAGYDTFVFNAEKLLLGSGDKFYAAAGSASGINAVISYLSI